MKIAIIGYGRMGHMVEQTARERGHKVECIIDEHNREELGSDKFKDCDVAIEFTRPDAAVDNVLACFAAGVPVVSGTTGWQNSMPSIKDMCDKGAGTLLWASNFSIGVNVFMAVNRYMASLLDRFPQYSCEIEEVHHVHKLDHPSGTAVTLAETIEGQVQRLDGWAELEEGKQMAADIIPVAHRREGEVAGIHTVKWTSHEDTLTFTHSANGRRGFALGAVMAAEWLERRKGFYTVADMFGF